MPRQVALVDGGLRLSVNAFLIDAGGERLLIDTGASDDWEPSMGRLPAALTEAGIDAGSVTTVAFTHTHRDHVHGLIAPGGGDGFPNLRRLLAPAAELDMFRAKPRLARFHERVEGFTPGQRIGADIEAGEADSQLGAIGQSRSYLTARATSARRLNP